MKCMCCMGKGVVEVPVVERRVIDGSAALVVKKLTIPFTCSFCDGLGISQEMLHIEADKDYTCSTYLE